MFKAEFVGVEDGVDPLLGEALLDHLVDGGVDPLYYHIHVLCEIVAVR